MKKARANKRPGCVTYLMSGGCAVLMMVLGLQSLRAPAAAAETTELGREVAIPHHLADGDEFHLPWKNLLAYGKQLFTAVWTRQEGGGRPLTKGTGAPLADPNDPLLFPRNFNRLSAPDANSCAGCHNAPFGIPGGGGDIVANVFVLAQRFDFATFDQSDAFPTKGAVDELGRPVTQQTIANSRATLGMYGSGYIEMLARQMTADRQAIRDATAPGESRALVAKGVSFGTITRASNGAWDASKVEGLPAPSLLSTSADNPPNLIIGSLSRESSGAWPMNRPTFTMDNSPPYAKRSWRMPVKH